MEWHIPLQPQEETLGWKAVYVCPDKGKDCGEERRFKETRALPLVLFPKGEH